MRFTAATSLTKKRRKHHGTIKIDDRRIEAGLCRDEPGKAARDRQQRRQSEPRRWTQEQLVPLTDCWPLKYPSAGRHIAGRRFAYALGNRGNGPGVEFIGCTDRTLARKTGAGQLPPSSRSMRRSCSRL